MTADASRHFEDSQPRHPRDHHYCFAHRSLPQWFHKKPEQFLEELLSGPDQTIQTWWRVVGESLDNPVGGKMPADGLSAELFPAGEELVFALITLPKPVAAPEAYFIAAVYEPSPEEGRPPCQRFVMLEYARLDPDECSPGYRHELEERARLTGSDPFAPSTRLCEWTSDGHHCTYEASPPPNRRAFIDAVDDLVNGRSPYETPATSSGPVW